MARTDFEPLSWEEAEQNRRESLQEGLVALPSPEVQFPGVFPEIAALLAEAPWAERLAGHDRAGETPAERGDRLRSEIKRGKEYLEQAERDLAESRALLEDWPAYEQTCGKNPLTHLTQSVLLNGRIAHFLAAWVKRREAELESLPRPARG
jgi:hypothetical protein